MDALNYLGAKIDGFEILQELEDELVIELDLILTNGTHHMMRVTVEKDDFNPHQNNLKSWIVVEEDQ